MFCILIIETLRRNCSTPSTIALHTAWTTCRTRSGESNAKTLWFLARRPYNLYWNVPKDKYRWGLTAFALVSVDSTSANGVQMESGPISVMRVRRRGKNCRSHFLGVSPNTDPKVGLIIWRFYRMKPKTGRSMHARSLIWLSGVQIKTSSNTTMAIKTLKLLPIGKNSQTILELMLFEDLKQTWTICFWAL